MKAILSLVYILFSGVASAQSSLPACNVNMVASNWTDCFGSLNFPTGDKYVGEWKDGKPDGQGAAILSNGDKYVGGYRNGRRHGQGTFTSSKGIPSYVGEWSNGEPNGQGVFVYVNGDKYTGEFKDGKRWGRGILANSDGKSSVEGSWENNRIVKIERTQSSRNNTAPPPPRTAELTTSVKLDEPSTRSVTKDTSKSHWLSGSGPEDFIVYFPKMPGYAILRKLDGSFVFSNPTQLPPFLSPFLKGRQPFCAVYNSEDVPAGQHELLLATLADFLQSTFGAMGVANRLIFDSKNCPKGLLDILHKHSLWGAGGGTGRESRLSPDHVIFVQQSALNELLFKKIAGRSRDTDTKIPSEFSIHYVEGPIIAGRSLASTALVKQTVVEKERESQALRSAEFEELVRLKSREKIASVTLSYPRSRGPIGVCRQRGDEAFSLVTDGYLATEDSRRLSREFINTAYAQNAQIDKSAPFSSTFKDLDDAFTAIQRNPNNCHVFVDFPENVKTLISALKENEVIPGGVYEINPLVSIFEARTDWAKSRGYPDFSSYEFAKEIGGDYNSLKRLSELGISTRDAFFVASQRMTTQKYSTEAKAAVVIQFLEDEAVGAQKKVSAIAIRSLREKEAEVAERRRAQEADAERKAHAKRYPFYAVLSCSLRGRTINIMACFTGSGSSSVHTELMITQGNVSKVYKNYEVGRSVGRLRSNELLIDLERNFSLKAQNASDTLVLTLTVYDRGSDQLILQREAGRLFGVVAASN